MQEEARNGGTGVSTDRSMPFVHAMLQATFCGEQGTCTPDLWALGRPAPLQTVALVPPLRIIRSLSERICYITPDPGRGLQEREHAESTDPMSIQIGHIVLARVRQG